MFCALLSHISHSGISGRNLLMVILTVRNFQMVSFVMFYYVKIIFARQAFVTVKLFSNSIVSIRHVLEGSYVRTRNKWKFYSNRKDALTYD